MMQTQSFYLYGYFTLPAPLPTVLTRRSTSAHPPTDRASARRLALRRYMQHDDAIILWRRCCASSPKLPPHVTALETRVRSRRKLRCGTVNTSGFNASIVFSQMQHSMSAAPPCS